MTYGIGNLVKSKEVFLEDTSKLIFKEFQNDSLYKLDLLKTKNNLLYETKTLKIDSNVEAGFWGYEYLGCFNLPMTNYYGVLLMHKQSGGEYVGENIEIIGFEL